MGRFTATVLLAGLAAFGGGCGGGSGESDGAPAPEPAQRLTGTVTYRERMALPPGTEIEVRLEDVSIADAPAVVIAEQVVTLDGRQVPVAFELTYDRAAIEQRRRYGVRAGIRAADGALLFTTTEFHAAFADGRPVEPLEIVVQRVARDDSADAASPGATGPIAAGPWRLTNIRRPDGSETVVSGDASYTLEFGADGRYGGLAHCNRYTGGYTEPEPGSLTLTGGATTLMACPDPSLAGEFLMAVGQTTGYEIEGNTLRLQFGADGLLVFARDSGSPQAAAAPPPGREVGRTFVFDCDGDLSFTVRTGPGEVALWAPAEIGGRYIILAVTPAASGARYASEDVVYWNRGELASFEIDGRRFVDCRSNPARVPWADAARRGAIFRAIGNEPAWNVEILADRIAIVTDLGASRVETPYTAAEVAGSATIWRGAAATPVVRADRIACADTMSGEVFEATATVTLADRVLYGCGRFL